MAVIEAVHCRGKSMSKLAFEVMSSDLTMVSVDTNVAVAEQQMIERGRRCVPVVDDSRNIFGVLSFSDIAMQRQNGVDFKNITVWEICSHSVFVVHRQATLHAVIDVMLENSIHHVLVLEGKTVAGIISVMDILQIYRGTSVELKESVARAAVKSPGSSCSVNPVYRL